MYMCELHVHAISYVQISNNTVLEKKRIIFGYRHINNLYLQANVLIVVLGVSCQPCCSVEAALEPLAHGVAIVNDIAFQRLRSCHNLLQLAA